MNIMEYGQVRAVFWALLALIAFGIVLIFVQVFDRRRD